MEQFLSVVCEIRKTTMDEVCAKREKNRKFCYLFFGQDASRMLGLLDLEQCRKLTLTELSGGQRRKVALVAALVGKAQLLILGLRKIHFHFSKNSNLSLFQR